MSNKPTGPEFPEDFEKRANEPFDIMAMMFAEGKPTPAAMARWGYKEGWTKCYEIEDKWKTLWENQGDTLGRRIQELVAELREAKAEYKRLRDELDRVKL